RALLAREPGSSRTAARLACLDPPDFGVDGGEHFLDIADHRIVGLGHDRRAGVRIDREDVLRRAAADHVLNRAANAAGDVEVGRDPRPGLAHLVAVWPPAEAGHRARAADGAAEQACQFFERGESLGAAHTAAPADDHARLCERDLSGIYLD